MCFRMSKGDLDASEKVKDHVDVKDFDSASCNKPT